MDADDLAIALARGYETRGIEFKDARLRQPNTLGFAIVVKAMLGMANRRDGGSVVLGVREEAHTVIPEGLSEEQINSWNYDDVAAGVNRYASPNLSFDREVIELEGKKYVVLSVHEFSEIPILCAQEFQDRGQDRDSRIVLRRGACYVRRHHKPETSEIANYEEMRSLLDLAIEKGVRNWVRQAYNAGLLSSSPQSDDAARFAEQMKDFL